MRAFTGGSTVKPPELTASPGTIGTAVLSSGRRTLRTVPSSTAACSGSNQAKRALTFPSPNLNAGFRIDVTLGSMSMNTPPLSEVSPGMQTSVPQTWTTSFFSGVPSKSTSKADTESTARGSTLVA
jgi:hypothetical protein